MLRREKPWTTIGPERLVPIGALRIVESCCRRAVALVCFTVDDPEQRVSETAATGLVAVSTLLVAVEVQRQTGYCCTAEWGEYRALRCFSLASTSVLERTDFRGNSCKYSERHWRRARTGNRSVGLMHLSLGSSEEGYSEKR